MSTVYKVFNPFTGLYSDAFSIEEMIDVLIARAWDSYMMMTHQQPVSVVTINADGSQTWKNLDNDVIPTNAYFREQMKNQIIERLPITILGNEQ